DGVEAEDVLVELVWIEPASELARPLLRDEVPKALAAHPEDALVVREEAKDHLQDRERRILEPEQEDLRVLVEQRDHLARLGSQPVRRRRRQVDVREYDDTLADRPPHLVAELRDHRADRALELTGR